VRVLFAGAPVLAPGSSDLHYRERFVLTGENTGNLLIGHALRRQIAWSAFGEGPTPDPGAVDQKFDLIAIPAANFLFPGFDFGWLADFIERTSLPCFVVGLGAQAPSLRDAAIAIPEGTQRFVKVVADRSHTIGVRGEFTAAVLARLGVGNVTITGCPSLYASLTPELKITRVPSSDALHVSVNGSRNVVAHSFSAGQAAQVEAALIRLAMTHNFDYVLQNEFPEIDLLHGPVITEELREQVQAALHALGLAAITSEYIEFIRRQGKVFFTVEDWSAFIKTRDFVLGTRFHGNVIALVHGVPAVIFAHDARTLEMCEAMKIPHLPLTAAPIANVRSLYEETDYGEFVQHYRRMYLRYAAFFEANGIPHNLYGDTRPPPANSGPA
jgi:hypothetical protein